MNDESAAYTPTPPRTEVTVASLTEAQRRQQDYSDRRKVWTDAWHPAITGRTWPARRVAGAQVHDPKQRRLL